MRVEISRIAGDIYVNGSKVIFAVDFRKNSDSGFDNVEWLLDWAKIGLASRGYSVPHWNPKREEKHEMHEKLLVIPPVRDPRALRNDVETRLAAQGDWL